MPSLRFSRLLLVAFSLAGACPSASAQGAVDVIADWEHELTRPVRVGVRSKGKRGMTEQRLELVAPTGRQHSRWEGLTLEWGVSTEDPPQFVYSIEKAGTKKGGSVTQDYGGKNGRGRLKYRGAEASVTATLHWIDPRDGREHELVRAEHRFDRTRAPASFDFGGEEKATLDVDPEDVMDELVVASVHQTVASGCGLVLWAHRDELPAFAESLSGDEALAFWVRARLASYWRVAAPMRSLATCAIQEWRRAIAGARGESGEAGVASDSACEWCGAPSGPGCVDVHRLFRVKSVLSSALEGSTGYPASPGFWQVRGLDERRPSGSVAILDALEAQLRTHQYEEASEAARLLRAGGPSSSARRFQVVLHRAEPLDFESEIDPELVHVALPFIVGAPREKTLDQLRLSERKSYAVLCERVDGELEAIEKIRWDRLEPGELEALIERAMLLNARTASVQPDS